MQSTSLLSPQAPKPPSKQYEDIRNQIRNGDVLMYRGKSWESRIIMLVTKSKFSHAGIAVWWNQRLMVMEAIGKGVVVRPLSLSVQRYYGDVELYQAVEEVSDADRLKLIMLAQQELGKEYATWKATLLGLKILFQTNKEKRDSLRRERQLFCSYYVAHCYNSIGKDLKHGVSDRFMTPGDIAQSPVLKQVAVLRRSRK